MCTTSIKIYVGFATETEVCDGDNRLFVMEASTFDDLCGTISAVCMLWSLEATFYEASESHVTFSKCVNVHVPRNYHHMYM